MQLTPISWPRLTDALADRIAAAEPADAGPWARVAVDGPPAARPGDLADALAEALPPRGRPVLRVSAGGFLRPASLRYEHGRRDAEAYYDGWLDTSALWREVFEPLEASGSGRVLPSLWDPATDRATRADYVQLPPGGVLLLDGTFLQGHWFPFDLCVYLRLGPAALSRRTPEDERWTLPAFARYDEEVGPEQAADVVVRCDDPRRPAWSG